MPEVQDESDSEVELSTPPSSQSGYRYCAETYSDTEVKLSIPTSPDIEEMSSTPTSSDTEVMFIPPTSSDGEIKYSYRTSLKTELKLNIPSSTETEVKLCAPNSFDAEVAEEGMSTTPPHSEMEIKSWNLNVQYPSTDIRNKKVKIDNQKQHLISPLEVVKKKVYDKKNWLNLLLFIYGRC